MAVPIVIPFDVFELSMFSVLVESNEILLPSTTSVPSMSVSSRFVVPSMSTSPLISSSAATTAPVEPPINSPSASELARVLVIVVLPPDPAVACVNVRALTERLTNIFPL